MTTSQATGYEVRFIVGNEVYKTFSIGNYKIGTKTFTGLESGKNYKIQIRSYKNIDGVGKFYSAWSLPLFEDTFTEKIYYPNENNIKVIGRADFFKDTLWMVHSGSGAEFSFYGTKAIITMQGDSSIKDNVDTQARIAIYVNDQCVIDDMVDKEIEEYIVFESNEAKECTIRIIKLSEAVNSMVGLKKIELTSESEIEPTDSKEHFIEFIGDSITCGYGVDDEDRSHHFSTTTENVTKTYAYKTAKKLNTDYSIIAFSGYGVVSGFTSTGDKISERTVPQYYCKLGYSGKTYLGQYASDIDWNFTGQSVDLVVLNLGTNDYKYTKTNTERQNEYIEAYIEFLKMIRQKNPDAAILCTLGIMGDDLYPSMEKAVTQYKKENDDLNVYTMKFNEQLAEDGYAADSHPTEVTHEKAAELLISKIKEIMNW